MVVGSFGKVIFQVSWHAILTLDKFKRVGKHKFAVHEIINQVSKLESVGIEPAEISFEIKLVRELNVNVEAAAEVLREACKNGEADFLILGNKVVGGCRFVIETMEEDTEYWQGTSPGVMKINLKLKEYQ